MGKYKKQIGAFGEEVAARYLSGKNFRILARNLKVGAGEIDILALEDDFLVFVEVKTRMAGFFGRGEEAMNSVKIKRLKAAAGRLINRLAERRLSLKFKEARIDLVAVEIDRGRKIAKIRHYRDAG